jgi:hypothetical protein
MSKRKTSKVTRIALTAIILFFAYASWELFFPHTYEPKQSSPADAERITSFAPPTEARNIRVAEFRHFQQFVQYLRFEAPPDVCLRYAESIADIKLHPIDGGQLENDARPFPPRVFSDFSWFDLDAAKDVVSAGGGPSIPCVWVDRSRGVFYYRKTD